MGRTPFYRTSNELECVHLLMIELKHLDFGFEGTFIKHTTQKAFAKFTKSFIEQTQTLFFEL